MNDISKNEILNAIQVFSNSMDQRFNSLESKVGSLESKVDSLESKVDSLDSRVDSLDSRVDSLESQMVTKDYLDRKLWSLKSDMHIMMKDEIHKHEVRMHH